MTKILILNSCPDLQLHYVLGTYLQFSLLLTMQSAIALQKTNHAVKHASITPISVTQIDHQI